MNLRDIQDRTWKNKVDKGFNTTNIEREFNYTYAELAEAYDAYRKASPELAMELADTLFFVLSLSRMLGIDIEAAVTQKMELNEARRYRPHNGHNIKLNQSEEN